MDATTRYLLVDHFNGHRTLETFHTREKAIGAGVGRDIALGQYLTVWRIRTDGNVGAVEVDIYPGGHVRPVVADEEVTRVALGPDEDGRGFPKVRG
jgi:hypothetical protein